MARIDNCSTFMYVPLIHKEKPVKIIDTKYLTIAVMITMLATSFSWTQPAAATTTSVLDSASFDFSVSPFPDPAAWVMSAQGSVVQQPIEGYGLGMSDPGNASNLMYIHPAPFLGGDTNDPNFPKAATFRVKAQVPYVSDGSSTWSAEAISWRMILDDGSHHLELALSRSSSYVRQVRIQNSTSIPPMDFPWDNGLNNTYEIMRLEDGNYVITLTNADISNPSPVITQTIPAGQLPPSSGTSMFAWGMGTEGGGVGYWQEAHAEIYTSVAVNVVEDVSYAFVYPQTPDPAIWNTLSSGNVVQQPVEGLGWGMTDPDNLSMLLYTHSTPYLSGDPNDPNFYNTAVFRVKSVVPYITDGSAWLADAVGWRMILDDGTHRLEVLLSRSATGNRQIRFNNSAIQPFPFSWDNDLDDAYEIIRFPNGDFAFAAIDRTGYIVTKTIPAGMLPGSLGIPMFAWGTGAEGGGGLYWQEVQAEVYGQLVDDQPPMVDSVVRADPDPTNADHVSFTVMFSEAVSGVDVDDFGLDLTGKIRDVAITSVSGFDNIYTVTVATGKGTGTIRLDLMDNDSIVDGANNPLGGPGVGNGDFTNGEFYTIGRTKRTR